MNDMKNWVEGDGWLALFGLILFSLEILIMEPDKARGMLHSG